jgi:hypothetical protein
MWLARGSNKLRANTIPENRERRMNPPKLDIVIARMRSRTPYPEQAERAVHGSNSLKASPQRKRPSPEKREPES